MFTRFNIKRIMIDLSLKVTGEPFTGDGAIYNIQNADWRDDMALDSIEFMALAAAVNSFFNLFEINQPPYLLSSTKIDDWVEMVFNTRQLWNESISFNTSGTSGKTKIIKHSVPYLEREIAFLASIFGDAKGVIPYVPSYTIYGFLFTLGLPHVLQVPVVYPSAVNWQQLPPQQLIVATPFNWQMLVHTLPNKPLHCLGVSAAAPLFDGLYHDVVLKDIALTEIYGSTETGGIGYRQHEQQPFKLFPYWEFTEYGEVMDRQSGQVLNLLDDIELSATGTFKITGRKDKQVKIAGKLADMDSIATAIKGIPNIQNCAISAKAIDGEVMLQAFLTLHDDGELQRTFIKTEIRNLLPAHERPRDIHFS